MNDEPLEVGQCLSIGGRQGVIQAIEPTLRAPELRVVVQLREDSRHS
jgi:hypothetical protein